MRFLKMVTFAVGAGALLSTASFADKLRIELSKQEGPAVTYGQVEPIIKARCAGCHGPVNPKGDLTLSKFPFASPRLLTQERVVDVILERVVDTVKPMPPPSNSPANPRPPLTPEQIALIQAWRDGGLLTEAPSVFVTKISVLDSDGVVRREDVRVNVTNPFDTPSVLEVELDATE